MVDHGRTVLAGPASFIALPGAIPGGPSPTLSRSAPMTIRVRDKARPGDCSRDLDLGPAHGDRTPFRDMRREIDEAIVHAADRHRPLRVTR